MSAATSTSPLLSAITITSIGLLCKAFLNLGYCASVRVKGLKDFLELLEREDGRGVLTGEVFVWHLLPGTPMTYR
jgi:monolysocardiolipin acyltransferase